MKAKVVTKFYDSVAKVVRQKGDVFNVTPARFTEIQNNGNWVEAVTEPVKAEKPAENE